MFEVTQDRLDRDRRHLEEQQARQPQELDAQGVREAQPGEDASERMHERHDKLMDCLNQERDRQAENRFQMAKDEDYQDGMQWEPEDAAALIDRGQAPLVFNRTAPIVRWVTGTEKRTRIDWKVLPREQSDDTGAEIKTKVLKYVTDVNRTAFHRSEAFRECVVAGLGWLEDGVTTDPEADIVYSGRESWRNVYFDSRSRELDLSDARYLFRQRVVDLDVAMAMFPKAGTHLDSVSRRADELGGSDDDTWYLGERLTNAQEVDARGVFGERSAFVSTSHVDAGRREVVRLIEGWYRVPESVEFFANGPFQGKAFEPKNPMHVTAKRAGATTFNHVAMRMRCMIGTEDAPLWDGASWYRHNKFPLTPLWCYRRARDGMPYGIVRGIRDIQDDFNKRRSKALHILSVNRVVADDDAVEDPEELREEASRADGVILKKRGTELRFEKPVGEIQGNVELMQQDEVLMQDVSGIQSELMGRQTNATSGKAILARQEQGSMVTADIFDNLRLAVQLQGEKILSLVEQYYSAPKVLRIVGERRPTEWLPVNQVDPATGQVLNDITARQADFIVSEQDYRANLQQAAFEQLGDMLAKVAAYAPQVVVNLLDLLVDLADVPNKSEFVSRIRKLTGQSDPTKPPTPDEIAAQRQAQDKATLQEQVQMRTLQAQLRKLEAEAAKIGAQAITEQVNTLLQAIAAGGQVATVPALAPIADEIARSAGWQDRAGTDPNIPAPPAAAGIPAQPQGAI